MYDEEIEYFDKSLQEKGTEVQSSVPFSEFNNTDTLEDEETIELSEIRQESAETIQYDATAAKEDGVTGGGNHFVIGAAILLTLLCSILALGRVRRAKKIL